MKLARSLVDEVEFYAEDAGRTDNEFLARVVEAAIAAGARTILASPATVAAAAVTGVITDPRDLEEK